MNFKTELNKHEYRREVYDQICKWDREHTQRFLDNLTDDQVDDRLILNGCRDLSTVDLHKLATTIVWGWGWEGCDYFLRMYR